MLPEEAHEALCRVFCERASVAAVPVGLAVSTGFLLPDGDPLTFYVVETADGIVLEDDGDFFATAVASGLPIESGTRAQLLAGILRQEGAYLDRDTCQIRSEPVTAADFGRAAARFVSALIRARDLHLLTQEHIASTFAEDVRAEAERRLGDRFRIEDEEHADLPADFVVTSVQTGRRAAIVYAATSNERMLTALVRHMGREKDDAPVFAVVERIGGGSVSNRTMEVAVNRGLRTPVFGSDPEGAMAFLLREIKEAAVA
ncbi:DUF1828 domain-containing protein [Rubellimicrobium sp. CFH 75288]|uniref:DUF1828 domain-containing protein n=1 Tax=Rubellimicrobium sp. CFH 75288 TaxID=2697034 RepID=UPI001411D356|nr:DUF1828 domain-containing protein [Rubellimicrobium sp. CFH 75288]NAZ37185.1 DUF1828 domain-containing protein [Rubellimicrobium sp. CFH 75288]